MTMTLQTGTAVEIPPAPQRDAITRKAEVFLEGHLSREERDTIMEYASTREAEPGEILWREGERGEYLAVIISGKVQTLKDTDFGETKVVVGLHGEGDVVGVESVVDDFTMPETARVTARAELLVLTRADFERLLEESPAFAMKSLKGLLQIVSIRLRHSVERLSTFF